jgi:hypothetical protein
MADASREIIKSLYACCCLLQLPGKDDVSIMLPAPSRTEKLVHVLSFALLLV